MPEKRPLNSNGSASNKAQRLIMHVMVLLLFLLCFYTGLISAVNLNQNQTKSPEKSGLKTVCHYRNKHWNLHNRLCYTGFIYLPSSISLISLTPATRRLTCLLLISIRPANKLNPASKTISNNEMMENVV